MEIYNENAYDLLDKKHLEMPIEQWNKVNIFNIGISLIRRWYEQYKIKKYKCYQYRKWARRSRFTYDGKFY